MSTYLELVQQLVGELGIGGANNGGVVPTTVSGQTGQLWNATKWIRDANNNINVLWSDWKYLARDYSEPLTIGNTSVPAHSGSEVVAKYDRASFWLDLTLSSAKQLGFVEWTLFRISHLPGSTSFSTGKPDAISQKRDGSLVLATPPNAAYTLTCEYWKRPDLLLADGDIPEMPEEFHRLILCEAAVKYGNKEAAGEIIQGMEAEYIYLMDKLEGSQAPGREWERQSSQDLPIEIEIPGFGDDELRAR